MLLPGKAVRITVCERRTEQLSAGNVKTAEKLVCTFHDFSPPRSIAFGVTYRHAGALGERLITVVTCRTMAASLVFGRWFYGKWLCQRWALRV